ncbi:MAG TPA: hypothetical protein DIT18_17030 [Pseudomonas sp.]|nr:hypothetical protein [Pseudomonas sp.]
MKTAISCIKPELLSLDRQSRKLSTWTADNTVFQVIDRKCRLLAEKLATLIGVRKNVLKNIRKGSGAVWLFVREDHFGKAYLLNRFLVHLLAACVNYRGAKPTAGRMELTICFNSTATEYSSLPATGSIGTGHQKHRIGVLDGAGSRNMDFDEVVVRYGIEKGSVPGAQMIQLSKKPSAQRTVLNRIELPFVVE